MSDHGADTRALSDAQIQHFIDNGFVRIDQAFSRALAEEARSILWRDLGCAPDKPASWTKPVVRLGMYADRPFAEAANTPLLHAAFDQLVGAGRWDASFDWEKPDFMDWRVNIFSKGRALLMLFLFSDVGEDDAPTRIRAGSHLDIARMLVPAGEAGLTLRELVERCPQTEGRPEMTATGDAGTVYLCHPFLVHAAQPHRGKQPRFLAQPPLLPRKPQSLDRPDDIYSPVEIAIRKGAAAPALSQARGTQARLD